MPNVKLSAAELALANDASILLTKNRIIQKVYELFGELSTAYTQKMNAFELPASISNSSPKISRGENYLGLPWVMLDQPRHFNNGDIFSIRTMFWWGHHFAIYLIVKGEMLPARLNEEALKGMQQEGWCLSLSEDPWTHHFEPDVMQPMNGLDDDTIASTIRRNGMLKVGHALPLTKHDEVMELFPLWFEQCLNLVCGQLPKR